ncbi:unnamed protein product, partial [Ectocarpus sp. 12 AP-2014]
ITSLESLRRTSPTQVSHICAVGTVPCIPPKHAIILRKRGVGTTPSRHYPKQARRFEMHNVLSHKFRATDSRAARAPIAATVTKSAYPTRDTRVPKVSPRSLRVLSHPTQTSCSRDTHTPCPHPYPKP